MAVWIRAADLSHALTIVATAHEAFCHAGDPLDAEVAQLLGVALVVLPRETVEVTLAETRRRVGPRIYLAGGIDMSQLLSTAEPDEVREACRQAVRDAYPGYFMGSTTEADNSCRLGKLLAMREVALEGAP